MADQEQAPASRRGVQSIDRAVAVLRCFGRRTPELGITEISRTTGLSTSTVHRLLSAMQHNGLVQQAPGRRYALGPLLVQLARSGAFPTSVLDAARPVMHELRDRFDETIALHELLASNDRAVVDQVESHQELRRTYTNLGSPIPLPLGAPGKVLLAYAPDDVREAILRRPIPQVTPTTVTDAGDMQAQLEAIRSEGYAMSFAERTPGIRTVASPVFDHTGRAVACVSICGPEIRMPRSRMDELAPEIVDAAARISARLGATGYDGSAAARDT